MKDWVKILTGIMLLGMSFTISYFVVNAFEPVIMVLAFLVTAYLSYGFVNTIIPIRTVTQLVVAIILSIIAGVFVVWFGASVVKVIAFFALAWVIFRLMVKYLAKEIEKDLREVFEE